MTKQHLATDDMVQCPACQGQGVVKQWPGDRTRERECKYCEGIGDVIADRADAYFDRHK